LSVTSEIRNGGGFKLLSALGQVCEVTQRPRLVPLLETLVLGPICEVGSFRNMVFARVAAYGGCRRPTLRRVSTRIHDYRRGWTKIVWDLDITSRCVELGLYAHSVSFPAHFGLLRNYSFPPFPSGFYGGLNHSAYIMYIAAHRFPHTEVHSDR
jgi:hypothetical protein